MQRIFILGESLSRIGKHHSLTAIGHSSQDDLSSEEEAVINVINRQRLNMCEL